MSNLKLLVSISGMLLSGAACVAHAQSAGSIILTGPVKTPGAPQNTPALLQSKINAALTLKADFAALQTLQAKEAADIETLEQGLAAIPTCTASICSYTYGGTKYQFSVSATAMSVTPSASGTLISTTSATPITDASGHTISLVQSTSSGLQAAVNGTADATTQVLQSILFYNSNLYVQNTSGAWYTYTAANGLGSFTQDPRITGSGTVVGAAMDLSASGAVVASIGGSTFSWFNQGAATVSTNSSTGEVDIAEPAHPIGPNQAALITALPASSVAMCITAKMEVTDPNSFYNSGLFARNASTGTELTLQDVYGNLGQANLLADVQNGPTTNGNPVIPQKSYIGFSTNVPVFFRYCQDGSGNINELASTTGQDSTWTSVTGGLVGAASVGSPDHMGFYEDAQPGGGQTYTGVAHLLAWMPTAGYTPQAASPGGDLTNGWIGTPLYPVSDTPPTAAVATLPDGLVPAPAASYTASIVPIGFTGSISGNVLTVTAPPTSIPLAAGKWIYGSGVSPNTIIYGPGSASGTWIINNPPSTPVGTVTAPPVVSAFTASTPNQASSTTITIGNYPACGLYSGETISGTGIPSGTTITGGSGGSWTLSNAVTLANNSSLTATATETFTASTVGSVLEMASQPPCPLTSGVSLTGTYIPSGQTITGGGPFANTWTVSQPQAVSSEAMITPELEVSAVASGTLTADQHVLGSNVAAKTTVELQDSGSAGGAGNYAINYNQTVSSEAMTAPGPVSKAHYDFTPAGNVATRAAFDADFYKNQNIFGNQNALVASDGILGDTGSNWGSPRLFPASDPFNTLNWTPLGLNTGVTCALNNTAPGCTQGNLLGTQIRLPGPVQLGDILTVRVKGGNSPVFYQGVALYGGVEYTQYPNTYFSGSVTYDYSCYDEMDLWDGFQIDNAHGIGHSLKMGVVPVNGYASNANCYALGLQQPALIYSAAGSNFDYNENTNGGQTYWPYHFVTYTDTYSAPHDYSMELMDDGSDRIRWLFDGRLVAVERYHMSPTNPGWAIHLLSQTAAVFAPESTAAANGITPDNPIVNGSMSATYQSIDVVTGGIAAITQPLDPNGVSPSDAAFIPGVGDALYSGTNH